MKPLVRFFIGDTFQIIVNTILGAVFLALIPVSLITALKRSVPFLVAISLWALVAAHWSASLAAWAAKEAKEIPSENG